MKLLNHTLLFGACLFLVLNFSLKAQTNQILPEVEIRSKSKDLFSVGVKFDRIDSLQVRNSANLVDALQAHGGVFLRQYGPAQLTSPSFRGTSAAHTQVVWKGMPINSALNGQSDLALFPMFLFDGAQLTYGSSESVKGIPAMGGSISLLQQSIFDTVKYLKTGILVGSFGLTQVGSQVAYRWNKVHIKTTLSGMGAHGAFPYELGVSKQRVYRNNADFQTFSLLQEMGVKINKNAQLEWAIWWQQNERGIPSNVNSVLPAARQDDQHWRSAIDFTWQKGIRSFSLKHGFQHEKMFYKNVATGLLSHNDFQQHWINAIQEFKFHRLLNFRIGAQTVYSTAWVSNFNAVVPQYARPAFYVQWSAYFEKLKTEVQGNFRQEWSNLQQIMPVGGIGMSFKPMKAVQIKSYSGTTTRVPVLNDLYWQPGGNLQLQPEQGFHAELGVLFKNQIARRMELQYECTAFHLLIDQWLIWLPSGNFWSPQNLRKVWSRGLEHQLSTSFKISKSKIQYKLQAQYVLSTQEEVQNPNDASLYQQMIYVPRYQMNHQMQYHYKKWIIGIAYAYTGIRFTSSDNLQFLPAFEIWQCSVHHKFDWARHSFNAFIKVHNLMNVQYQVIQNQPMPGIQVQFGLTHQFKFKP